MNLGPRDYESPALPTELQAHEVIIIPNFTGGVKRFINSLFRSDPHLMGRGPFGVGGLTNNLELKVQNHNLKLKTK